MSLHSYRPIVTPQQECTFSAWVNKGEFHIQQGRHEVFIPLPLLTGWYRFQYQWGDDQAYLSYPGRENWYTIPIRIGSKDFY